MLLHVRRSLLNRHDHAEIKEELQPGYRYPGRFFFLFVARSISLNHEGPLPPPQQQQPRLRAFDAPYV